MTTIIRVLGVAAALGVALTPAHGQDQTVVFQHGFYSTGATWGNTPQTLRQQLRIAPYVSSTASCSTYTRQARDLDQGLSVNGPGLPGPPITVGHSNGGIVSREFNRLTGKNDRVVTIGTPHHGAPLAAAFLRGDLRNFGAYTTTIIGNTLSYYYYWDDGSQIPFAVTDVYAPAMHWIGRYMEALAINVGFGLDPFTRRFCPVLNQMVPGSRFLTDTLNSVANLTREASALRNRIGIVSDMSPYNAFFHVVFGRGLRANLMISARWGLYAGSILAYFNYIRSPNPILSSRANDFLAIAAFMLDFDAWWARLNGSLLPGGYVRYTPYPFVPTYILRAPGDGVVPLAIQQYPQESREYAVGGVAHTEEATHSNVVNTLLLTMRQDLGVATRPAGSVATVDVTPPTLTLGLGGTGALTAVTKDVYGAVLANQPIAWASSAPSVVSVSSTGTVTGVAAGSANVVASSGGYSDTTVVTVVITAPFTSVAIGGPASVTAGLDAQFQAQPVGGAPPFWYKWSVNGTQKQLGTSGTFNWAATRSYSVSLQATDALGVQRSTSRSITVVSCSPGNC